MILEQEWGPRENESGKGRVETIWKTTEVDLVSGDKSL